MKIESIRQEALGQTIALSILVLAVGLWIAGTTHPYYFGDELAPFYWGDGATFSRVFSLLNLYKPRLAFHAFWAILADLQASRLFVGLLVFVLWSLVVTTSLLIARKRLKAPLGIVVLVGLIAAFSRFAFMLRYDYLAASIELGALLAFLIVLYKLLEIIEHKAVTYRQIFAVTATALVATFIHERYLAAFCAMSVVLAFVWWQTRKSSESNKLLLLAGTTSAFPVLSFFIATTALSDFSIATGTAGQSVSLNSMTGVVALRFLSNVFVGTNFGHPWFVGTGLSKSILLVVVVVSASMTLTALWAIVRKGANPNVNQGLLIALPLFALVLVASLPGIDRAEARWMFPVSVLAAIALAWLPSRAVSGAALAAMVGTHTAYLMLGGSTAIFNVEGSRLAASLGGAVRYAAPSGSVAVALGFREPDVSWVVRGSNFGPVWQLAPGRLFSLANDLSVDLMPESVVSKPLPDDAFGLLRTSGAERYVFLRRNQVAALLAGASASFAHGEMLGGRNVWRDWAWSKGPIIGDEGLELMQGMHGFYTLPAAALTGKFVVYRARTQHGRPVSQMRLQIRWTRKDGAQIGATIKVVDVGPTMQDFAMFIAPPSKADLGEVYATLHDASNSPVLLEAVRLVDLE